ncbi:MAG TPA: HNH endonuclease signature motif containing protein [Nocardioides sp.]|nr:HNH endonuclease signature motif containing protein [Nocardioides sp.]
MDLGNTPSPMEQFDGCSASELLDEIQLSLRNQRAERIREWCAIVAWADVSVVDAPEEAATIWDGIVDTAVPIAGPGAPLVSEFKLMELIAVLGRSHDSGRLYVGRILEVAWRLPQVFTAVIEGRCEVWRALRVADLTLGLPVEATDFIDRQRGPVVSTCTWAQIERLVAEAITRFDPDTAEQQRREAGERRHFDIDVHHADAHGLVDVHGVLDAADALDLNEAVARRAKLLGQLGSEDSLDVRRSVAAGELARQDLTLDLQVTNHTGQATRTVPGRKVQLYVHLTDAALAALMSTGIDAIPADAAVGRLGNTRTPVSPFQVKEWLQTCGTSVTIRPVIDLADHVPVDSYEIPDRLKAQVQLRDHHCAFPNCSRRAETCDLDHTTPHGKNGVTCPCNLVPLCRRHHRAKTHDEGWRYVIVEPGRYLWLAPTHRHFLVDHRGTRALDPPRRLDPETMDVEHPWETGELDTYEPDPCPADQPAGDQKLFPTNPPDL